MRLLIIAVGHKMPDWVAEGYAEYAKRMPREARLELIEIKPEKRAGGKTDNQIKEAEKERILTALPRDCEVVALDERGDTPTTLAFAESLKTWLGGGRDVAFIIGGADGLHNEVKQRASRLLALSRFTLPHGLVRVVLAEQLYRAQSVIHHHPYHRE